LSDTGNRLLVKGDANDTVNAAGFTQRADQAVGATTYAAYTQGAATLLVAPSVQVVGSV